MDIFERVPPQSQYRQSLSAREKAVRMERRIERATERAQNLRERYNTFRATGRNRTCRQRNVMRVSMRRPVVRKRSSGSVSVTRVSGEYITTQQSCGVIRPEMNLEGHAERRTHTSC